MNITHFNTISYVFEWSMTGTPRGSGLCYLYYIMSDTPMPPVRGFYSSPVVAIAKTADNIVYYSIIIITSSSVGRRAGAHLFRISAASTAVANARARNFIHNIILFTNIIILVRRVTTRTANVLYDCIIIYS